MKIYNSATHTKEEFVPHEPGKVSMYTCGPTVYHFAHIGNLRSYIMEDVLEKLLRYAGYDVTRVMNITDVGHLASDADTGEDKMLKGAQREHKTVMEIAQFYTDAFFADCKKLNIKYPDVVQPATGMIGDYIKVISSLIDRGYAYFAGGNVYFDTSKLEKYYVFNDHDEEDLAVGVREGVEEDANKRNKNDFVLWFTKSKFEDQALKWDSPWGVGYPGWHIECSAMVNKYLGPTIDIHSGGLDLIFPHHENEIAQSECANGCTFAHYWLHNGFLTIDNEKMSKSKGNFFMVRDAAKQFGYETIRMFMLSAHYRTPLNYSAESLEMNKASLARLYEARNNMEFRIEKASGDTMTAEETEKLEALGGYKQKFIDAMDDDLNTADALSAIFELTREINAYNGAHQDATRAFLTAAHDLFMELTGVLNLVQKRDDAVDPDAEKIEELIAQRAAAKKAKDFAEADRIRGVLADMGVTIKDTRQGTQWSRS